MVWALVAVLADCAALVASAWAVSAAAWAWVTRPHGRGGGLLGDGGVAVGLGGGAAGDGGDALGFGGVVPRGGGGGGGFGDQALDVGDVDGGELVLAQGAVLAFGDEGAQLER